MQPQIPTPAKFFFIILTHPHLGGVISPSRALRDPTTAPKQPDIPPKMTHFPYHVFKRLKWCHATTNTHTRQIFLYHTNSSTSGRGNFPIQGPSGPHHSPKTARNTPKITYFLYQFFKWLKWCHATTNTSHIFLPFLQTHPFLVVVIYPSRDFEAPTTALKQPEISPKMTHFI